MKAIGYKVRFIRGTDTLEFSPDKIRGLAYAGIGSWPGTIRFPKVTIKCHGDATGESAVDAFLLDTRSFGVEIIDTTNNRLTYYGKAKDPAPWIQNSIGKSYSVTATAEVVGETVDVVDFYGDPYDYIRVDQAIKNLLDASGVDPARYDIRPAYLDLDTPTAVTIGRITPAMADPDLEADLSRRAAAMTKLNGKLYIAFHDRVIEYDPATQQCAPAAYLPEYIFKSLGTDGSKVVASVVLDYPGASGAAIRECEFEPDGATWKEPTITVHDTYLFYSTTDVEAKITRYRTYGDEEAKVAFPITESVGYPTPDSEKGAGVPEIGNRNEGLLSVNIDAGVNTFVIYCLPAQAPRVGWHCSFGGNGAEQLGIVTELLNLGDDPDHIGYVLVEVTTESITRVGHKAAEDIFFIPAPDYPSPNFFVGHPTIVGVKYDNDDLEGGPYPIETIIDAHRRHSIGTDNNYFKSVYSEGDPLEVEEGWHCLQSQVKLTPVEDRYFAPPPRHFRASFPPRCSIMPDPTGEWKVYQNSRKNDQEAPGRIHLDRNGVEWSSFVGCWGEVITIGDWVVAEWTRTEAAEPYTCLYFFEWDGSAMVNKYQSRQSYYDPAYYLRGAAVEYNGVIVGGAYHRVNEWRPLNSRIVMGLKPGAGELGEDEDVPTRLVAVVVAQGDIKGNIENGTRVAVSDNTTEITHPDTYVASEVITPQYRLFEADNEHLCSEMAGEDGTYNGEVTIMAWFNADMEDDNAVKQAFCGKYIWVREKMYDRPMLYNFNTDTLEFDTMYLSRYKSAPPALPDYYDFVLGRRKGIELDEASEEWKYGVVYSIPDSDITVDTVKVYRGDTELNVVEITGGQVPRPDFQTVYIKRYTGEGDIEYRVYATEGGAAIYANYEYIPAVQISSVIGDKAEYAVDTEGYVYEIDWMTEAFTPIGRAPAGALPGHCTIGDDLYFLTVEGHLVVISPKPPTIAEKFGGNDLNVVKELGKLVRQSGKRFIYTNGEYRFNVADDISLMADAGIKYEKLRRLDKPLPSLVRVSAADGDVYSGDVFADSDATKSYSTPYVSSWIAQQLADQIYRTIQGRVLYKAEGISNAPDLIKTRRTTIEEKDYEILQLTFDRNDVTVELAEQHTGEVIRLYD